MPGAVLQRVAGASSGLSRALPSCQPQTLRAGTSLTGTTRGSPTVSGTPPAGVRRAKDQPVAPLLFSSSVSPSRSDGKDELDPAAAVPTSPSAATGNGQPPLPLPIAVSPPGSAPTTSEELPDQQHQPYSADLPRSCAFDDAAEAIAVSAASAAPGAQAAILEPSALGSVVDLSHEDAAVVTTYIPVMQAPSSPARSSAPCSPASSVILSGACASSTASASCRLTSCSGTEAAFSGSLHSGVENLDGCLDQEDHHHHHHHCTSPASPPIASLPSLSFFAAASLSGCSSRRSSLRDQNSVTIKATTVVKDAAGAIDKILSRGVTALVTALRSGGPPYGTAYDSLNQAVKAIAVARQYAKETGPDGAEVTFLPFHRNDSTERVDPCRFAFLVFPVSRLVEKLKTADETVLNVARGSDVHKMAGAIIAVMLDRGQAVMKAAGSEAIFVAMSAVVNARHRLVQKHGFDLMLAAAWITEDTVSTMGRESKFLRFNILKTEPAGPKSGVAPTLPAMLEAC